MSARVEINKFANVLHKGSRLRMWIEAPSPTGEYEFSYIALPATNKIWHDGAHPARLVIGELRDVEISAGLAPCGTVLKQPCRKDPLAD